MSFPLALFFIALGLIVGAAFAAVLAKSKSAALAARSSGLETDIAALRSQLNRMQAENSTLLEAKAGLDATLASERRSNEEKQQLTEQLLTEAGERARAQFESLAA